MNIHKISLTPYGSMTTLPDSQTIFGAMCWSIRELYGEDELEELLNNFIDHKNKFVVSSSFIKGLFKAPVMNWATLEEIIDIGNKMDIESSQLAIRGKQLNKMEYMSEKVFKDYLEGELDRKEVVEDILTRKGKFHISESILQYKDEKIGAIDYYEENSRRNFINRMSGTTDEGKLFYYNRSFLKPNTNLYFLIKTEDIDYFSPVFRYMSDNAIGGDRSIGVNGFKVIHEGIFNYTKNIEENVLLSKYIPYYEEINWEKSMYNISIGNYKIESRHDFFGKDILKSQIGYIVEGSRIVLRQNKEIYGRLPIVKEINNKEIRHNGLGFFL
ncbi:type III-A CRISPR-associated RAMP protein Csm4 [Clostridium sp. Cult1]|uniref:type III-A CRISPR-associated RAMP protein Csm4 n=1 Tax=Clostridium sp. Cult1 TaxID=2079002 RepID=UPI001F005D2E|nr:type III-A CRISPR-associated RAMP protein Csm4 [Clostridium sp. Cult1]MCF6464269.1 type III-A CRISPR-associated RAMP protein Csm4 [Clostridium sp. Cult1]